MWLCKCSCGQLCEKTSNALTQGSVTSCGHDGRKKGARPKDISGRKFGELTAVEPTEKRKNGSIIWKCRCSCGEMCEVSEYFLVSGTTTSCGHKKRVDLTGKRYGRLVAIKPQKWRSKNQKNSVAWLCKCDCGSVVTVPSPSLIYSFKLSCGCISTRLGRGFAKCPGCGELFEIPTDGGATPQFCPMCAPKYAGQTWKVCPICRKLFPSPPSASTVTCSKECSSIWKSRTHEGVSNKWNEAAKARKREEGQTDNLRLGTEAAMRSPIAGRFETNREAKIWHLVDPSGNEIVVRNLLMWARQNTERFGKPEGDKSARQIASGFKAIAATLSGKRKTPAMTYFGWTLKYLPQTPED